MEIKTTQIIVPNLIPKYIHIFLILYPLYEYYIISKKIGIPWNRLFLTFELMHAISKDTENNFFL